MEGKAQTVTVSVLSFTEVKMTNVWLIYLNSDQEHEPLEYFTHCR